MWKVEVSDQFDDVSVVIRGMCKDHESAAKDANAAVLEATRRLQS
jgi:hypothetical protein